MHREWFLFDKPRRCGAIYSDAVQSWSSWKPFFMLRPAWLDLLQSVHIFFWYCHFCTPCFAVQRPQLNQLEQNEMRYATVLQIIEDRYVVVYGFKCPVCNVYTGKYVIYFCVFFKCAEDSINVVSVRSGNSEMCVRWSHCRQWVVLLIHEMHRARQFIYTLCCSVL